MDLHLIPLDDYGGAGKVLVYRPLLGLAFVGNPAMARLASSADPAGPEDEALEFLRAIGFFAADPPGPALNADDFHPTTAVLLLTNQCSLRCIYCYAAAGERSPQTLAIADGEAVIAEVCRTASSLGRTHFDVSFHGGGEPTTAWETLTGCTAYARRQVLPARISLTTNAVWSERQGDWILEHLNGLTVSMDGAPETQNRQRPLASGRGSSAAVLRNLERLDGAHFPYGIRMTALPPFDSLAEDVRFLCEHTACASIQVEPAFNRERGRHDYDQSRSDEGFAGAFMAAYEIARAAGRRLHYSGANPGKAAALFCFAPINSLIVRAGGELVSCYEVTSADHPLMDISGMGRVIDGQVIGDREARSHLIGLMAERRAACADCLCAWACAGDCYTRTYAAGPQGHLEHGLRCQINREITVRLLLSLIAEGGGVWRYANRQGQQPGAELAAEQEFRMRADTTCPCNL